MDEEKIVEPIGCPVDKERLREFDKILREYKAGKARLERRVVSAEQWWKLRNESEARKQGVAWDEDFVSRSGWLHNVLVSKHADAMENYPEPLVLPREPGDKDQAKTLSAILPVILEQNKFEKTYSDAWWQKLKTGTGVYKVTWDADKHNGLGDVSIQRVDLLSIFWEPGISDIQKSRYIFHVELQDNDLLEEQYPQLKDKLKGNTFTMTKYIYDDNVPTDGKSAVIDVYYKRRENGRQVLHYCKYVGNEVLFSTENEAIQQEPVPEPGMEQTTMGEPMTPPMAPPMVPPMTPTMAPEDEHFGLYDDGEYPFVFDPLFPIEGSPCGYGYVDLCQNSQIAIDILRTAFVKNTKVGATPRYFQRVDGAVNEEEFKDLTKSIVHVNSPLDETGLRVIDTPSLPGNYLGVYDAMISELRETSGNTESANGIYSGGVTAASSIAALQEASGKTSRDASRASYRAFAEMMTMVIERIRQFYDLPRQFRITGQYGEEQFVAFDNSMMRPQPIGIGTTDMGYKLPVFDVKVEIQKRNAYTRTSQNELALQMYQLGVFNPQLATQTIGLLDMMDFEGKQELMQKVQQNGGLFEQLQQVSQLLVAMYQKYEPENAPALAQSLGAGMVPMAGGGGESVELTKGTDTGENKVASRARDRANQAASV